MLTGENGILTQAQRAKEETEKAQANEESVLDNYEQYIEGATNGGTLITITGNETSNTRVQDSLGNKVVVPAGFRVVNPGDNVEDGIIIEDVTHEATKGSQFVWIPVGTIHRKDKEDVTITLGRYAFDDLGVASEYNGSYTEDTVAEHTYDNTPAKDITTFISKVNNETHGYYIGRYEARTSEGERTASTEDSELTQITVKPNDYVYNYVTQLQAAKLSRNMYSDTNFESDLVNGYAWDTAIDFLQKCDDRADKAKPYSRQNSLNTELAQQGTNNQTIKDVICNIYDMASNCWEWSTETSSDNRIPCVRRGGYFSGGNYNFGSGKSAFDIVTSSRDNSFRSILYL